MGKKKEEVPMIETAAPVVEIEPIQPPSEDLTIKEMAEWASGQLGKEVTQSQVRTAHTSHEAFKPEGAVYRKPIKGSDVILTYTTPGAAVLWLTALRTKVANKVERRKSGGLMYQVQIPDEKLAEVTALLQGHGLTVNRAFKAKKAKPAPTTNGVAPEPASDAPSTEGEITLNELFPVPA